MSDTSPKSRLKYQIFDEFRRITLSVINEADPYRMSKALHLKNWCRAFFPLFIREDQRQSTFLSERLEFFLDILSDEDCWEKTDTIHQVSLNRRIAAKKIVQSHNRSGMPTPLDYGERYRLACWCCLEEDIFAFFEYFKQNSVIKANDPAELNRLLARELCHGRRDEPLTCYWTRIAAGLASEMEVEGKHLYEIGLESVYVPYVPYVEAVEYFWSKINALPENELSDIQKYNIFMKTAITASSFRVFEFTEILEYCLRQMPPSMYSDFLSKEYNTNRFVCLDVLQENLCFDLLQQLFHHLDPEFSLYITFNRYYKMLKSLVMPEYPENYAREAVKLFKCMWRKEECHYFHKDVLDLKIKEEETLLVCLIMRNYMELLWEVLDSQEPARMKIFMKTQKANYIASLLQQRGDQYSLNKFLSYNYAIRQPEPSTSSLEVKMDVTTNPSPTKKQRLD